VLLTFDDGASGLWRYADAVLEDQGFEAVAFPISGRVGTKRPYYLTWQELERLYKSGRWAVESHTRMGHDRIVVDGNGTRWPFLINRAWLEGEGRLETSDEFADRVEGDLEGARDDLVEHGFPAPRLFAYPFSAETSPTNDPAAPARARTIVAKLFAASMTNVLPDRVVSDRDRARRTLPRLEVFRATTVEMLHARIAAAAPTVPGPSAPLGSPVDWTDSGGEPLTDQAVTPDIVERSDVADGIRFGEAKLELAPSAGKYLAASYVMGKSADWTTYRVATTVSGLGTSENGPTGSVFALIGSGRPVQAAVSATYVRVATESEPGFREVMAARTVPAADSHRVELAVGAGSVTVLVDGITIVTAPVSPGTSGGIGVAASGGPVIFTAMELAA
jgi:poly-beta-1,6-N-acetyl-D-glucosamine N-deacetylase